MAKSVVLGNGNMVIGLDEFGQVYDLHYPYVGLENHTRGSFVHKIGVWVDGKFSWLDDGSWILDFDCFDKKIHDNHFKAISTKLEIELDFNDAVYNEKNIFLRDIKIINKLNKERDIRIFFNQQFEIYESKRGDTAYYDPHENVMIHYKGRRIFLINARDKSRGTGIDQYSVGLNGIEGKEGTFVDAQDGELQSNPIEHGLVDSVVRLQCKVEANESKTIDYWMCVGKTMDEVYDLNNYVLSKTPSYLIRTTKDYWKAWVGRIDRNFADLDPKVRLLFENSLHIIRVHSDNRGGIIASSDSDLLKYGRDGYAYVWPRDGAFTSMAMSTAGYSDITKRFLEFANSIITREGYFMHKYRPDGSLGSSWHPWVFAGEKELPIQIDETALIVCTAWKYYEDSRDVEFIEEIYNSLIKKAIEFIITRINKRTGIITPSYDLWEERFGTGTFTSCTVYGALIAASKLAKSFGKKEKENEYFEYASLVLKGILDYHYDDSLELFHKRINQNKNLIDSSVDISSLYGIFKFGLLPSTDEKVQKLREKVKEKITCNCGIGGVARHEDDPYFRVDDKLPGNPWILTTLWVGQLDIAAAKSKKDLKKAKSYIDWALSRATKSGVLAEQINPHTGDPISAAPLTWSHAEFIVTVLEYIDKYNDIYRIEKAIDAGNVSI